MHKYKVGDMILVRNNIVHEWRKRKLLAILPDTQLHPYICEHSSLKGEHFCWKYAKSIDKVDELTLEQVCKELGRDIKIVR